MRSLWCALVAVCLVVGGLRTAGATRAGDSELHAAKVGVVAHAVHRAPRSQRRIGAFVAPPSVRLAPAQRPVAIATPHALDAVADARPLFVKSSRGPPRA